MSASREAIYAAGAAQQQQQQPVDAAPAAMDVDRGAGGNREPELQQLVFNIRSCLKQLQDCNAAGSEEEPIKEKLVQLQQQAALLCK